MSLESVTTEQIQYLLLIFQFSVGSLHFFFQFVKVTDRSINLVYFQFVCVTARSVHHFYFQFVGVIPHSVHLVYFQFVGVTAPSVPWGWRS